MHRPNATPQPATAWRAVACALLALVWAGPAASTDAAGPSAAAFKPQAVAPAAANPAAASAVNGPTTEGSAIATAVNDSGVKVVVIGAHRRVAVIDGRIARVGDTVNGLRVRRITAQGVDLVAEDGTVERLSVNPAVTQGKRPAGTTP